MYKGSLVEDILSCNSYLYDFGLKAKNYGNNKWLKDFYRDVSKIDSIRNYDEFKETICRYKKDGIRNQPIVYGTDSLSYGHIHALYQYAGLPFPCDYKAIPGLEHGVDPFIVPIDKYEGKMFSSFWYQSAYKKKKVHHDHPQKPVFVIGPYIHYARHYYDQTVIDSIKKKNGKTLLVFPYHDYELSSGSLNESQFVDFVMNELAHDYETVIICVYWNDVNRQVYELFQSAGAILVSAGYRGDPHFIQRLKTLIELSDAVCGNSFGTNIGYAISMNKPFVYFPSKIVFHEMNTKYDLEGGENGADDFDRKLLTLFGFGNKEEADPDAVRAFYEFYWGGEKYIRTPQEITCMIGICEVLQKKTKGFCFLNDHFVKELLSSGDDLTRRLLRESLADE